MRHCAYCGAWFGMDSAHQCVGSISARDAEIQADAYNRGYQAGTQASAQPDAQTRLYIAAYREHADRTIASCPDAAERRRYALLQAAATISGLTCSSRTEILVSAAAIANAADTLLAEIERREKEFADAQKSR